MPEQWSRYIGFSSTASSEPASATAAKPSTTAGRVPIAAYASYGEAERAVDYLSDHGFPVERVVIVGEDVRLVEQVIGRLNYGGAALRGAGTGAVVGLLTGWVFGLFSWIAPLVAGLMLAAYGLIFGAVAGALLGLLLHALQGGRRDFSSIRVMQPSRYQLYVDIEVAAEAERKLANRLGGRDISDEPGEQE